MGRETTTAPALGAEAAKANDVGSIHSQYTKNGDRAQPLATYHLARRLAGAGDFDGDAIKAAWPDAPLDDFDALRNWVAAHSEVAEAVSRADPEGPPPGGPPLDLLTADEILTTDWPEPVWAIPRLLPSGLTILAGKPKLGKSWLGLQIAQAVAAGGVALGERVQAGPILYLALEDPPRRLRDRMMKQRWSRGLPADFLVLGEFADQIGDLRSGGGEILARQIESRGYRLVTVDTLSRSVYGDQSDVEKMTAGLMPMQEMAHVHNCAVVMIDHHKKGFGADPDAVGDILGSTAKGAMADCIWGLYRERNKSGAKLAITGRDVVEQNLVLKFDGLTGCWQCEGDADGLKLTENRQAILDALEVMGEASLTEIAEAVDRNKGSVYKDLKELEAAYHIVKTGKKYRMT